MLSQTLAWLFRANFNRDQLAVTTVHLAADTAAALRHFAELSLEDVLACRGPNIPRCRLGEIITWQATDRVI
jgi:hypothetical protein